MRLIEALRRPKALVLGTVLGGLVLLGADWLVVRPRATANDDARSRLEALRAENAKTEGMIADYERFKLEAAETERQFAIAVAAVPSEAELAGALEDLEGVTAAAGVSLVRFSPHRGRPSAKPATAARAALQSQPITIALRGTYADFQGLLGRLAGYDRLLTVEGFRMRSATAGPFTLEATVELKCYFKQIDTQVGREVARR